MKKLLKKTMNSNYDNTIEAYSCDTPCGCGVCSTNIGKQDDNDALDVSATKKF